MLTFTINLTTCSHFIKTKQGWQHQKIAKHLRKKEKVQKRKTKWLIQQMFSDHKKQRDKEKVSVKNYETLLTLLKYSKYRFMSFIAWQWIL